MTEHFRTLTTALFIACLNCGWAWDTTASSLPSHNLGQARASYELHSRLRWHTSYLNAWNEAERDGKMLLIWFVGEGNNANRDEVAHTFATDQQVRIRLEDYVLLKLPYDAIITSDSQQLRLLDHAAFIHMEGCEGLAIVDLTDPNVETFEHVVSAFPFVRGKYYQFRASELSVILDLPPGTITQRTMVWAVRVHPERPASTEGEQSIVLVSAASEHSQYQASINLQGHHQWESRFHELYRQLDGQGVPVEVVAESWPDQNMIDSCIDCVASWRHSSGHWQAVSGRHAAYGYDIHRGSNGIWYGTGIFASGE